MHLGIAPGAHPRFEAVVRSAGPIIRRTARSLHIPGRDYDDVAQKILLAVFNGLPSFDPARPLIPWLRKLAYRTARDHVSLAYMRREVLSGVAETVGDGQARDSELRLIAAQTGRRVAEMVGQLESARRVLVRMHYFEDLDVAEIAGRLEIPESTVRTRLRLARADLAAAWRADCAAGARRAARNTQRAARAAAIEVERAGSANPRQEQRQARSCHSYILARCGSSPSNGGPSGGDL